MTPELINKIESLLQREFDPQETMQVLTHNQPIFWSWGVSNKINYKNKALILKVSARRFKSYVVITLAWNDTYTVNLINPNGNVKKSFEMVYFDNLVEIIDDEIEKVKEYKF